MSHWAQFSGFPQQPPLAQQQQQQQQIPNVHFQQGYTFGTGQLNPQPTGFSPQRPIAFHQTGFQPSSGFLQSQPTGFVGGSFQQQRSVPPPPPPPVPPQQPNQSFSFLNAPPPQPSRFLTPSPSINTTGLVPQPTGFTPRTAVSLVPQLTGYVDPRLQMMSSTFMPMNTSTPYSAGGAPLLATQQHSLQQSFQQHNQVQRGTTSQQMSWALSKAEKKQYDQIFRSWDAQSTGFINGQTALEVFGASGLQKDDLARIWALADKDNRGSLNIAEFHVAMGLIYRRLNGMPIPDQLPPELVPPSARDLDNSVDMLKDLLKHESRSPSALDAPVSRLKNRSFNSTPSSLETGRDATIYKHDDSEPPGGFYQPRSRHINRDDVRSRNDQGASADLTEMKRKLANTAEMLDRAAEAEAVKTVEDGELEREMDDLKYRVQRVSDDLEYVSRGPRSVAKDEEKRRLERELLSLMHERIPELERRIKARDERREREKRQWARDRDRVNDRFGRYDPKDDNGYSSRRYDDRDRPYSRGAYDTDGKYGRDYDRMPSRRDRSRSRERERERERPRSPPSAPSPPPGPAAPPRNPPPAPPKASPSPASAKNMTPEERQAFAKAEARRRIEARMAALGVTSPSTTSLDTSVEERLQQEKKEAEEKALASEKQAEERERLRRERLESEKALRVPEIAVAPSPASVVPSAGATLNTAPTPPPAPKPRAPAPPPPPRRVPAVSNVGSAPPAPPAPVKRPVVVQPTPVTIPEVNPEEEALRMREEALRKQREARAERLRQLEKEEEEAARREEEEYQARLQALKVKATAQTTQPVSVARSDPPSAVRAPSVDTLVSAPAPSAPPSVPETTAPPPAEKSTNPFSRFINNKDANMPVTTVTTSDNSANPWAQAVSNPTAPSPPKSPFPSAKPNYNTAPSTNTDDEWDEIKENEGDDESSDDEIVTSRATRANIAQQLFGNMLPRPTSGAAGSPVTSPVYPAPAAAGPPPPPPLSAPSAPVPPPVPSLAAGPPAPAASPGNMSALMQSIQGGTKLRHTKTVDKSGPSVSGRVLGDTAPPSHISASLQPPSPPSSVQVLPELKPMDSTQSNNRQSVDWFTNRAVDASLSNSWVGVLPTTSEEEEHEEKVPIPTIQVEQLSTLEGTKDLLSDIDKSIEYRVRSLYSFTADGPDDLSFGENLVLVASPSKSGGDWWYGTLLSTRKSGLFPKTFVQVIEPVTARALYEYSGSSPDELSISPGDIIPIIDKSDVEWWKAERDGVVYIVPATYVEIVEGKDSSSTSAAGFVVQPITASQGIEHAEFIDENVLNDVDDDDDCLDDSTSDYVSFESEDETDPNHVTAQRQARERERQMVLEAAGLIVNQDVRPPPTRSAPAVPRRRTVHQSDPYTKVLPPLPDPEPMDHTARLDDAYERFESFRNLQLSNNRLSVISTDSANLSSPTVSSSSSFTITNAIRDSESQGRYSTLLQFLSGLRTQEQEKKSVSTLSISRPISGISADVSWSGSPAFGSSWASLVDSSALEGMPVNERKRQEAIFELIITESAYVRDLQLIVEIFYAAMLPMLSEKEVTVIFTNIEDILLTNTVFLSSLEERQKESRLYIDKIGDILHNHLPNMGVYMEYCVNQATAAKVLQSLMEANHDLAQHLQYLRDSNPAVRNLDLSSYLLAPMQRITKYPLLIKQIQQYTEAEDEQYMIRKSLHTAEMLLDGINEAIRDQEGRERLRLISQNLWIGTGRLDLTAPTRYIGARKLLREGLLIKAKSGRRLHGFLCSDILVLTDASMKTLYRLPIPIVHSQALVVSTSKEELTFQISQSYPRGGDKVLLKTKPAREGQAWVDDFNKANRRCHRAEERARKSRSYLT